MDRLPLSVAIITYNEEDIIGRTLESVKDIASEIVVVDSRSTDRTREIAESYGARVYVEDWKGYAGQKNSALEKCTQEWVLFLDADEVVSEELRKSIREELKNPKADGYLINRRTYYMGRLLRYTWQPEWRLRLVLKGANPRWEGRIHESLFIDGKTAKLKGCLLHFPYKSVKHQIVKGIEFAKIDAEDKFVAEKKVSFTKDIVFRPVWTFLKEFIIKKSFLDGKRGFLIAVIASFYTFMKYSFLYERNLRSSLGDKLWERNPE